MSDKIILVTPPDDILIDGFRILLVSLDQTQTQLISKALYEINDLPNTIVYVYNPGDDTEWLFDKRLKSDLIIFDAEADDQALVGYLTSKSNAYYFGTQKTLQKIANSAIYDIHDIRTLIEEHTKTYTF